jgi:hypothetical protein
MEKEAIKYFRQFKEIEPGLEYCSKSLGIIFATSQIDRRLSITRSIRETITLGVALVLTSLLLLVVLGGFSSGGEELIAEGNPGFNIEIGEAEYYSNENSRREVALRLQLLENSIRGIENKDQHRLLREVSELRRVLDQ